LVAELGLFQEVLDSLCLQVVGIAADALHFFNLACLARRLDVLEVDVGLGAAFTVNYQVIWQLVIVLII